MTPTPPLPDADVRAVSEIRAKMIDRVSIGGVESCWEWQGSRGKKGYGLMWDRVRNRSRHAHRVAYELWHAPIPVGLQLDHVCRNPACCNPRHLEPVTRKENILRGISFSAENAQKTHCPQGHEFTPENTYVTKKGWRQCRACKNEKWRNTRRARKLA